MSVMSRCRSRLSSWPIHRFLRSCSLDRFVVADSRMASGVEHCVAVVAAGSSNHSFVLFFIQKK